MKLHVLFGQRNCAYKGEYAIEAIACINDDWHSDYPEYLNKKQAEAEISGDFERLSQVEIEVSEDAVIRSLYPERFAIAGTVVPSA